MMLLLQNMKIDAYLPLLIFTLGISAVSAFIFMIADRLFIKKAKTNMNTENPERVHFALKGWCIISVIVFALACFDFMFMYSVFGTAKTHGMTKNTSTGLYNLSINEMRDYNNRTPEETKINLAGLDELKGKIIIVYRYECSDCLVSHQELKALGENPDVIFLSSRIESGIAFRNYFEPALQKVPSGIYIRNDGKPVTLELYYSDHETETVKFDYENWDRLLNIQKQDTVK